MIREFMYEHYPQLRRAHRPGNPGRQTRQPTIEEQQNELRSQAMHASGSRRKCGARHHPAVRRKLKRRAAALRPAEEAQRPSSLPGQEMGGATPSAFPVVAYGMVMMFTNGFRSLPGDMQAKILGHAMKQIHPYDEEKRTGGPDFIVYDPDFKGPQRFEDQGRSMHVPVPQLSEKCYAKLDDYGSAAALSESMGERTGARYTVTFLLAGEY